MSFLKRKKSLSISLVSVLMILTVSLFLFSCAEDYDTSEEIAAERVDPKINVLIDPNQLNDWVTNGYENDTYGISKVVVLFVGTQGDYENGHIPGSYLLNIGSDLKSVRSDGVSPTIDMVATKDQMDGLIQKTGIDGGTVVVLTTSRDSKDLPGNVPFMVLSRAYFNFRYWGFPRSKIRVLDGYVDKTWTEAGYALEFATPKAPEPSTYSVCYLKQDPDRFRATLEDMINVAKDTDDKTVVIDSRTSGEYNGNPSDAFTTGPSGSDYVAFEGHIRTAKWQEYSTSLLDSDGKFKQRADLITEMIDIGVNESTTAYPYCRTSWRAAITFLALDGVLNYPVKLYDGAWIEWGQMTAAWSGALDANSKWRTDLVLPLPGAIIVDNSDDGYSDMIGGDSNTNWLTSINPGTGPYYGKDFAFHCANNGDTATWTPSLPSAGDYEVLVWHTAKSVYDTAAPFTINHNNTSDTVTVNLTQDGNSWVSLGTYTFDGVSTENVILTDSVNNCVVADAVAFVPVSSPITPETPISLSEAVRYNPDRGRTVETLLANSFASRADEVNRTDAEICSVEGPGGGAGGGGDSGGY